MYVLCLDMTNISLLLTILLLVFGVMGVNLFGQYVPEYFGSLEVCYLHILITKTFQNPHQPCVSSAPAVGDVLALHLRDAGRVGFHLEPLHRGRQRQARRAVLRWRPLLLLQHHGRLVHLREPRGCCGRHEPGELKFAFPILIHFYSDVLSHVHTQSCDVITGNRNEGVARRELR